MPDFTQKPPPMPHPINTGPCEITATLESAVRNDEQWKRERLLEHMRYCVPCQIEGGRVADVIEAEVKHDKRCIAFNMFILWYRQQFIVPLIYGRRE